ncbi:HNH endonuclease signature motif containing protein [Avibacterium paragallinarum]|uniref:HNH endonuclease n=2 Tax=Avibacterium paragallinarum TaxID=728 RepID=A0A8B3T9Z2_AVIPA|nr:HNH endonuclease signature motif containing protein [Avibacterium paragallinarum]QIR12106.1 HNH endonuclease [Avibacterium paragallinarum]QJE09074.1 HNH endonuclease [Avibacterium paragallinarum]QJE11270.1 HNH endonuclease [Avibacterium paragallinarum]QJE13467.1 HNH endonuclease [Avibacterium paragallinarum]QJE15667.1 HNH endonuclease [Avibacterium paragallinarum]
MTKKRFRFTDEHIAFIREHKDLAPKDLIQAFYQQFGLLKNRQVFRKLKKRLGIISTVQHCNRYTKEELAFIKENCTLPQAELTKLFNQKFNRNQTAQVIRVLCAKRGWLTGRNGRFKKGEHLKPIGYERFCPMAKAVLIKTGVKRYERKSRVIWEQAFGKIPQGFVLWFKDGNIQNCELSNLELISRNEMLWRHKLNYHELDSSVKQTFNVFIQLREKLIKLKKQQQQKDRIAKG